MSYLHQGFAFAAFLLIGQYAAAFGVEPKEISLTVTCTIPPEENPGVEVQGATKVKATNAIFSMYPGPV